MLLTVLALASLAVVQGGYNYNVPNVQFHLPTNLPPGLTVGQSSQAGGTIVGHDVPEKSIIYSILPNNNNADQLAQLFTPRVGAHDTQYTHNVNSGLRAIVNGDSNIVSHQPIDHFNHGSTPNLIPVSSPSVETQHTVTDLHKPVQNLNIVEHNNNYVEPIFNTIGVNGNNGYISSHHADGQRLNPVIGPHFNNGYAQNIQSNLATSQSNLVNLHNIDNNGGQAININDAHLNYAGSPVLDNYNQEQAQIYANRFSGGFSQIHASVGVNFNNALAQNLIPPLETVPSTGALPLQNLNNVNTNTFPPVNSVVNSGFSLVPIPNAPTTINDDINNVDIPHIASAPPAPIITKNIYFHVPPPDVEEPTVNLPPIPTKRYKIIFIKVPSQESSGRLQLIQNLQNAEHETKTIIYVLLKKPELPAPVVVPQTTKSDHEVFFVKYNESPEKIASEINEELAQTGSIQSIVPELRPGLANGEGVEINTFRGDQGGL